MAPNSEISLIFSKDTLDSVLKTIEDIQISCYKHGIRTHDCFRDHDKLRAGICTSYEFKAGIDRITSKVLDLSTKQVNDLTLFYTVEDDGRVHYKAFCDLVENTFNIPELEKKPTAIVFRPPRGTLSRYQHLNTLSPSDEDRLAQVMMEISNRVQDRRLQIFPFFKDFDRGKCFSGNVTKSQFGRILHILGLNVLPEDLRLLCLKFEEKHKGDINYAAFCQAADYLYKSYRVEECKPPSSEVPKIFSEQPLDTSGVNLEEILARIREFCMVYSIRLREAFQDYDPLRSYSITNNQFRRALGDRRVSLSNEDMEVLCRFFADPKHPGNTRWKDFTDYVDEVFTQVRPSMERTPTQFPTSKENFYMPTKGRMDWATATQEHREIVERVLQRFRDYISQRRLLIKPTFESFDRLNRRHVTRAQFKQCLTILNLAATDEEMGAVEAKFSNDQGFNYAAFIEALEQPEKEPRKYEERMKELKHVNTLRAKLELEYEDDIDRLIARLKCNLCKKPVRVVDFLKDFDVHNRNVISKINFFRGLEICGFKLVQPEKEIIFQYYTSESDPEMVDYRRFAMDLDTVFEVHHLEQKLTSDPRLCQASQSQPFDENLLTNDQQATLELCQRRLARRVLPTRMQLFPPFQDFDRTNSGAVSRDQFKRVLKEQLGLGGLVSERDYSVLFRKYAKQVGGKIMVNYHPFCNEIYRLAHIDFEKP